MDISSYLNELKPLNVLNLVDMQVLTNLLNGYSYALGSGITLLYPVSGEMTIDKLRRIDALGDEARRSFHPLCSYWRDSAGCNKESFCVEADRRAAMKYFDRTWRGGLRLYRCEPLGLWDMTFPLSIDEHVVGVLFGGQSIVENTERNWRDDFKQLDQWVDWASCPEGNNHSETIDGVIESSDVSGVHKSNLRRILAMRDTKQYRINELKEKIEHFRRFGENMQALLIELYDARKTAAEQKILRQYSEELSAVDLTYLPKWWEECDVLLRHLHRLVGVDRIYILVRKTSRFCCEIPRPVETSNASYLKARDVISILPIGRLVKIFPKQCPNLFEKFQTCESATWGFHSRIGAGAQACGTLVVFCGNISERQTGFFEDLSRVICDAVATASLIYRERKADAEYQQKVALIGHSMRTPLQSLQLLFEGLEGMVATPLVMTPDHVQGALQTGKAHIFSASEDLIRLLDVGKEEEQDIDVVQLISEVMKRMEPIAQQRPCAIVRSDKWPQTAVVRGIHYDVQRAFTNLIDNAIKYSFQGLNKHNGRLYEVRVAMNLVNDHMNISIYDFGIGIPKDKLEIIRDYGTRAEIDDGKIMRLGTGLGLPYSIEVFDKIGGVVNIESSPSRFATEEDVRDYKRYITKVEVSLPILKRSQQNA